MRPVCRRKKEVYRPSLTGALQPTVISAVAPAATGPAHSKISASMLSPEVWTSLVPAGQATSPSLRIHQVLVNLTPAIISCLSRGFSLTKRAEYRG